MDNNYGNTRLSEIDPSRRIDDSTWVVSLARNSHADRNNQHVFIVLEGKDRNRAKTYFMDFVAERPIDLALPGIRPGKIRFNIQEGSLTDSLLFSCPLQLMRLVPGQRFSSYSCNLDRTLCVRNLVEKIYWASMAAVQPQYNVLGCDSVFAQSSAVSTSNEVGHNCFSWACQQLKELNDPGLNETMPQALNDHLRFIIGIPSRALLTNPNQSYNYNGILNRNTFLGVVVIALGILGAFTMKKSNVQVQDWGKIDKDFIEVTGNVAPKVLRRLHEANFFPVYTPGS